MRMIDEVDTARAVIHVFALTYHLGPDGELADKRGRPAHPRVLELVTEAMAALS